MAEGFMDYTAGAVLTAAQVDDYLMRQTVMRFASAAARDTALTGVVVEGMAAYLKDTDIVTMYTGSAWVEAFRLGAWDAYTPTCHQSVGGTDQTLTIAKARWNRQGRTIRGAVVATVSAAGSATNGVVITHSMPVTPQDTTSTVDIVGSGYFSDAGGPAYAVQVSNTSGAFVFVRTDTQPTNFLGVDPGFALANGDYFSYSYQYEAAS